MKLNNKLKTGQIKPLRMFNKLILLLLVVVIFSACKSDVKSPEIVKNSEPRKINHYNIKIVSDLSNRLDNELYPRQLTDQEIINEVLEIFPTLYKDYNRLALQKDKLTYGLLNPLEIRNFNDLKGDLTIDLGQFGTNQNERIEFIRNSPRSRESINTKTLKFKVAIDSIYSAALDKKEYYTADTWGYFNQVIDEDYFSLTNPINSPKAKDISRNIVILLTDGFIELASRNNSSSCPKNICDLVNNHQIEKFREFYNNLEEKVSLKEAFENSGFGIEPVNNPNLKNIEFLLLEINGRSKTKTGRITKTPSDFEILKVFWVDFLENEGAKKVSVKNVQTSTDDINLILKKFLNASEKNEIPLSGS